MKLRSVVVSTGARLVALFVLLLSAELTWLAAQQPAPAFAQSPAVGGLTFSKAKNDANQPIDSSTGFVPPIQQVWVTFDYSGWTAGTRLSRIVRFNEQDIIVGDLQCCPGGSGRYAFPISATPPGSLPEGGFEVIIYINGVEAQRAGFAVLTTSGSGTSGSKDQGGNDNGNDNGNGNGNGNNNGNDNGNDND